LAAKAQAKKDAEKAKAKKGFSPLHALAFALLVNEEAAAQGDNGWTGWKALPRQRNEFLLKPFGEIRSRNVPKDDVQPVGLV
jgi:hypothetical protein